MKNLLIILLSILFCCCSTDDNNPKMTNVESTLVESTLIAKGNLYGNGMEGICKQNLIISDQTAWQNLITQMNSYNNVSDNFFETDINFDSHLIIAVFLEVKPNGWEIEITNITENENSLVVSTNETELISSVINQPFSIVKNS